MPGQRVRRVVERVSMHGQRVGDGDCLDRELKMESICQSGNAMN